MGCEGAGVEAAESTGGEESVKILVSVVSMDVTEVCVLSLDSRGVSIEVLVVWLVSGVCSFRSN
jgi:hypothetical protein